MLMVQNETLLDFMKPRYTVGDVDALTLFLRRSGTLDFQPFVNGLFPAAGVTADTAYTGYARAWVRDNVHIAHALHTVGSVEKAASNIETLAAFFRRQAHRFQAITRGQLDPGDKRHRPPIRFRAETLEPDQDWANAQNDALGYFLWLYARMAAGGVEERHGV